MASVGDVGGVTEVVGDEEWRVLVHQEEVSLWEWEVDRYAIYREGRALTGSRYALDLTLTANP